MRTYFLSLHLNALTHTKMTKKYQRNVGIGGCPDCRGRLIKRTSVWVTPVFQQTYYACMNIDCGGTFFGVSEISHRISPSRVPNPEFDLPYTTRAERELEREKQLKRQGDGG